MNRRRGNQRQDDQAVTGALENVTVLLDSSKDPNGTVLITNAENLGRYLVKTAKMTTSQIRKLFTEVKKLDFKNNGPYQVNILRAKLAYTAGRYKQVKDLQRVLDLALQEVGESEEEYNRFADFFEAIVAYHKKYGGKE